ncbi:MAG TPA: CO dehydrogenase/acetyl-CoA synthase complex subunit epsilon [Methanothermococcus okinawensis]|uniref:Acetyl-CoA decarbonylase/synthase complex subunit alpha n=1 Tax=Methanothermococcus okinawensis TaxID=155863 RepID=A0A833E0V4_9EURY|nr:CO dehydrogenase/acetyl-CoA synthase complex subunit epsilon [Methanothermococcus okinawensis]HIP91682.1 CO dehydrogenase/acetyl-CoA synthase complex subunit epsilon [Methanothermococcus okinawensis]
MRVGRGVKRLITPTVQSKNLKIKGNISIMGFKEEEDFKPKGPNPMPKVTDLRYWDFKLLNRYHPFYMPVCDMCCLCTFGKCDLGKGKKGACGIDMKLQQARLVLLACCIGTACHAAHSRHLIEAVIEKLGRDHPIHLGNSIEIEAPIVRTVMGIKVKTLGDLEKVLEYCEEQLTHLLSATHTGQEGSVLDFESKALHAGMLDDLVREVGDIAQIVGYDMPKGEVDTPVVELGINCIDRNKPVILCIGHNVVPSTYIIDYMEEKGLEEEIEVCGICCTALDATRYSKDAKIVGPLSRQLMFIRSGVADVIVVDEQCIRVDILEEAKKTGSVVIATNDKMCLGLEDLSHLSEDEIINRILREGAGLILDEDKVGKVAVELARIVFKSRRAMKERCLPGLEEIRALANRCTECGWCNRVCPNSFPVMESIVEAKEGKFEKLADLYRRCYSCGRCESECERKLPLVSMITKVGELYHTLEFNVRAGRGPIQDLEIRKVGAPIVLGDIPGVVAFAGCTNYPNGEEELALMAKELLERKYIVVAAGCASMSIGMWKDEDGKTLYDKYPGEFKAGGLINLGPCLSNCHVSGAAIKIANIFAKLPLEGNFAQVADYILNRVGAVGVAWGAMSQKAVAIATGFNRWGIPLIVGPHAIKYRRLYLSDGEDFQVYDRKGKKVMEIDPTPEHLITAAENFKECLCTIAKLCMRPNDISKGRSMKVYHYVTLYEKYFNCMPPDLEKFIRTEKDIPFMLKDKIVEYLKEKGWKPRKEIPQEPTLLY